MINFKRVEAFYKWPNGSLEPVFVSNAVVSLMVLKTQESGSGFVEVSRERTLFGEEIEIREVAYGRNILVKCFAY